jgi:hypothetical protein
VIGCNEADGTVSICRKDAHCSRSDCEATTTHDEPTKTWSVNCDGTISGKALCSNTSGSRGEITFPNTSFGGSHCLCQMTSPVLGLWTYLSDNGGSCSSICAEQCAESIRGDPAFRNVVLATCYQMSE